MKIRLHAIINTVDGREEDMRNTALNVMVNHSAKTDGKSSTRLTVPTVIAWQVTVLAGFQGCWPVGLLTVLETFNA